MCVFRIVLLDKSFRLTNTFIPAWCSLWCQVWVPLVRWCQLQEAHGLASSTVHCSADGVGWIADQRREPFPCSDRSVSSIAYHRLHCQSQDHMSTLHRFSSRMFGKENNNILLWNLFHSKGLTNGTVAVAILPHWQNYFCWKIIHWQTLWMCRDFFQLLQAEWNPHSFIMC